MNENKHKLLEKIISCMCIPFAIILALFSGDTGVMAELLALGWQKTNEY